MIANYHTHTWRCNHASGTEQEYVEAAINRGLQILGFSDHTPHLFPDGYTSRIRMKPEQLADYVSTLRTLRDRYKEKISIHIGLEAEYYPAYFKETLPYLKDNGIEYLILGQHYIPNEPVGRYTGAPTLDADILKQYCHQGMEALQTGLFTYFAHPDLINFVGLPSTYRKYMREMIREVKACGLPVEVNLLGLVEGRHYPGKRFLEIVAEENCPIILGCDAHAVNDLSDTSAEEEALKLIAPYGLTPIAQANLKRL